MAQKVEPVPNPQAPLTPYICIRGAAKAIEFYKKAFGAEELFRMEDPSGKIGHAEIRVAGGNLMIADEFPEMDFRSPESLGGNPMTLHLYVKDVDAFTDRAVKAGMTVDRPVADQFYGDRGGKLKDPFGYIWWISTHKEDVSPEELKKRAQKAYQERQ
ncbi:VOC family protein [Bdellovibrio sp. BCCA]|uniref:VOC family protein n=1 Tax=Bdellovibrio sp. BCCA TaxID=3136281 RepID=UPI0030F1EFF9